MELKHEITREDENFIYGNTYGRTSEDKPFDFITPFMQLKKTLWFLEKPHEVFASMGITVDAKRAADVTSLFDHSVDVYYYVEQAASDGTDEAIKWIMGPIASKLKEEKNKNIYQILPPDYLSSFVSYLKQGKFERSYAKDIFSVLLDKGVSFGNDVRLSGDSVLDSLIADPRFKASDSSEIDLLIEQVIAANLDQAEKTKSEPKLVQWFVGQVMKIAKGKAPAQVVLEKLKLRLAQ